MADIPTTTPDLTHLIEQPMTWASVNALTESVEELRDIHAGMQKTLKSMEFRRVLLDFGLQLVVNESVPVAGAEKDVRISIDIVEILRDGLRKVKVEMDTVMELVEQMNEPGEETLEKMLEKAGEGATQVKDK